MKRSSTAISTRLSSTSSSTQTRGTVSHGPSTKRIKDEEQNRAPEGPDPMSRSSSTSRCSLEEALKCQMCLDVAVSPIYSCKGGGHILCSLCLDKLENDLSRKCPICWSRSLNVSAVTERMAKTLGRRLKCANVSSGCKEEVLTTDFRQHLKTCFFRDVTCNIGACRGATFKFNDYINHLQVHNFHPLKSGDARRIEMAATANIVTSFLSFLYDGKCFRLRRHFTDSNFYIWAVIMGDEREAKQYFATISLYGKQELPGKEAATSWTLPVLPFHGDPTIEREKTKPVFGSMERKLFVGTVDRENDSYKFKIRVVIRKIPDPNRK